MRAQCAGMGRMGHGQEGGMEMMQCVKVGKLNLVDLAGSERVHITGATGKLFALQRISVERAGQLQQGSQHRLEYAHVVLMAVSRGSAY